LLDGGIHLHALVVDVVVQRRAAVLDDVADQESRFDGIAPKAGVIAAHDHVTGLEVGEETTQIAAIVVVAGNAVVGVDDERPGCARGRRRPQAGAFVLHVEAKFLLARFVAGTATVAM